MVIVILTLLLSLSCCVESSTYTDWSASFSLSLPGSNGGIYTGVTSYSLTAGGWRISYDNAFVRVERFFVSVFQNISTSCGPTRCSSGITSYASNNSITYSFLAETTGKYTCAQKRWTFQIPDCAQSYRVLDCRGIDITKSIYYGCDPSCLHYDGLFINLQYVPISSNCVGKSFTVQMVPKPGYTLVPTPSYVGVYGDAYDGGYCLSCPQTGFSCHPLYTPLSSYSLTGSCCNVDVPPYNIPVLWLDVNYYNTSSKTLDATGCLHYTKQSNAIGVVTDIWVNNSIICRASFADGREYRFSNVVPRSFTPADFPPPDPNNCTCNNPLDIVLVLDRWSSFNRWSEQRNAALNLVQKFFLDSTSVQLSILYADKIVNDVLPLIGGCIESNILRAITSIGCENSWFNDPCLTSPCVLSLFNQVVSLGDRILTGINMLNATNSGTRQFSRKLIVVMYDGYGGAGDDGDAGFWSTFNRLFLSPVLNVNQINAALQVAHTANILTAFITAGGYTTLPKGIVGDIIVYNSSDYTTLTNNIIDLTARLCATNTLPCGDCNGLCACTQCFPPTQCVPSNECEILTMNSMGQCIRSDQLACNATQPCTRAICNDDGTCGEVSICAKNNSCFTYTCTSTGTCESHANTTSNPCLLSQCVLVNGIPTMTFLEKCPTQDDNCYSYGCNNVTGECYKIPKNPPPMDLSGCQTQTCTNGSWVVEDINCLGVPQLCLKGVCNNQTGQCLLVSTCESSGCVNRTCVNGNCTESEVVCPDISECLQPISCDPETGACNYKPCISTDPCRQPDCKDLPGSAFCGNESIPGLITPICNACRNPKQCVPPPNACNYNLCDPSLGCRQFPSCSSVNCFDTSCTVINGSATPNCTYTPIDCTTTYGPPSPGMTWLFQPVPLGSCCTEVPLCPPSNGCLNITADPDSNTCVVTSLCNSTGCPTQSCQTSNSGISTCVDDPITCPAADLCFDCLPGSCTLSAIPCSTTNLCKVSGQCSLDSGCFFPDKNCDDGNPCTLDSCNPSTGNCSHIFCNDSNPCTTDICNPSTGCIYTNVSCNDNNACTRDYCDPTLPVPCAHITNDSYCNDNNPCTNDTCNTLYGCVNTAIVCPKNAYGCSLSYCKPDSKGNATCYTKSLTCVDSIMPDTIVGASLAVAALAGIIVGGIVFVAAGGGAAVYVSQYVAAGANTIISVSENAAYSAHATKGGDNPLHTELHDTVE